MLSSFGQQAVNLTAQPTLPSFGQQVVNPSAQPMLPSLGQQTVDPSPQTALSSLSQHAASQFLYPSSNPLSPKNQSDNIIDEIMSDYDCHWNESAGEDSDYLTSTSMEAAYYSRSESEQVASAVRNDRERATEIHSPPFQTPPMLILC